MTETNTILQAGRAPLWTQENLRRAGAIAPYARYVSRSPAFLIGAAVVGVLGALAWRNRRRIAETARPMLQNAANRGQAMRERMPWTRSTGTPGGMQERLH